MVENEYDRGFENALDLVSYYIKKYDDKLPKEFVLSIKEIVQNFKDKKIEALKKELYLVDDEAPVKKKAKK